MTTSFDTVSIYPFYKIHIKHQSSAYFISYFPDLFIMEFPWFGGNFTHGIQIYNRACRDDEWKITVKPVMSKRCPHMTGVPWSQVLLYFGPLLDYAYWYPVYQHILKLSAGMYSPDPDVTNWGEMWGYSPIFCQLFHTIDQREFLCWLNILPNKNISLKKIYWQNFPKIREFSKILSPDFRERAHIGP